VVTLARPPCEVRGSVSSGGGSRKLKLKLVPKSNLAPTEKENPDQTNLASMDDENLDQTNLAGVDYENLEQTNLARVDNENLLE